MIITTIETFPLRIPFKPDTRAAASAWGDKGLQVADSLLVKVTTDQGLEGWGETGFRAVPMEQLAIDNLIAPLCIGRDATQIGLKHRRLPKTHLSLKQLVLMRDMVSK